MEERYLRVASNSPIIEYLHDSKIALDNDKLNEYVKNFNFRNEITFEPYRFLAEHCERSEEYMNGDEVDIIKVCHCWITVGYPNGLKVSPLDNMESLKLLQSPRVCFVTSLTKKMYNLHGKNMIKQLFEFTRNLHCTIRVYTEGFNLKDNHIMYSNIDNDPWLLRWIEDNKSIIPTEYGGECTQKMGLFNYNTSKWMKKVCAIRNARQTHFDYLIWVDCDSEIKQELNYELIQKSFDDTNMFYHQGPKREKKQYGIETGVVGFDNNKGVEVIDMWTKYYESELFRKLRRWDDGFVLRHMVNKIKKKKELHDVIKVKDLTSKDADWLQPLKYSIWNDFVEHIKGSHNKNNVHKSD